ncbi:hypothetical protein Tco_1032965 [Tanacetum coccineum]|uniref:Uncharacterized protein n=1 Tax=Tanacetum coccineum TaxID=301880 RepID=A0ABQ5GE52_9ASTR
MGRREGEREKARGESVEGKIGGEAKGGKAERGGVKIRRRITSGTKEVEEMVEGGGGGEDWGEGMGGGEGEGGDGRGEDKGGGWKWGGEGRGGGSKVARSEERETWGWGKEGGGNRGGREGEETGKGGEGGGRIRGEWGGMLRGVKVGGGSYEKQEEEKFFLCYLLFLYGSNAVV